MLTKSIKNDNITRKKASLMAPLCKGSWQTEGLTEGLFLAVIGGIVMNYKHNKEIEKDTLRTEF